MNTCFMRHLHFSFFAREQYLCTATTRKKNEIQLDFSQSPQRVELHFFLNEHLFLHAETAGFPAVFLWINC